MKSFVRIAAAAGSITASLLVSAAAHAQPGPQTSLPGQQRGPDLHALLHVRPDQEAAWRAFQQSATPPAGIVSTLRASAQRAQTMTTPERVELEAQNLALEATILHRQADAIRTFYTGLTVDQQHTWDQLTTPRMNRPQGPR